MDGLTQLLQGFVGADTNNDGVIQYEELVEVFNKMLQQRKKKASKKEGAELSYDPALFTEDELEGYLKVFATA